MALRAARSIQARRQDLGACRAARSPDENRRHAGTGAGTCVAARAAGQRNGRANRPSKCADGRKVTVCNHFPASAVSGSPTFHPSNPSIRVLMKFLFSVVALALLAPTLTSANERRAVATVDAVAVPAARSCSTAAQRRDLAAGAGRRRLPAARSGRGPRAQPTHRGAHCATTRARSTWRCARSTTTRTRSSAS